MSKVDKLEQLTEQLIETYKAKNADYGDSFADSFREFGITSAVVRMTDKMNRIKSLSKGEDRQVKDESLIDSLMDLANYALMTVIELENEQMRGAKGKPGMSVNSDTFDINEFRENLKSGFTITHNGKPLKALFEELVYSDEEDDYCELDDYEGECDDNFHYTDEELRIDCLEDGEKYNLRAVLSGIDEDENYLNLNKGDGGYVLADSQNCSWSQTEFTKDEVRNLIQNWDIDLDDFEIIEVESDYEAGRQENL